MKKIFLTLLLLSAILAPNLATAFSKTVTVDWTMQDTTGVIGYKMHYSTSADMSNKILACQTNDVTVRSLQCSITNIEAYPLYLTVSSITDAGEFESSMELLDLTPSQVQNFAVLTPGGVGPVTYNINFQPGNVPVPEEYLVDSGLPFDESRGYGWTQLPASASNSGTRDRDNPISQTQAYDTFVFIAEAGIPEALWELSLPNGNYHITLCMGDASFGEDLQNAQVEGIPIITNGWIEGATRWIEGSAIITIADGRLSLTFNVSPETANNGSTDTAKICWIKIVGQ